MKIMVTGAAGFIGAALTERLLARGDEVLGIDNLNDYYPPQLKHDRLARLHQPGFQFQQCAVEDREVIARLFADYAPQRVVHLAAQAGVRYSLENPNAYIDSNLVGFGSILEGCRQQQVEHLVYASSSSVYGANPSMPFRTSDPVDHPLSLYAATKKANELMRIPIAISTRSPPRAYAFSPCMALGGGQIWRCLNLPSVFWLDSPLMCIAEASTAAILLILMILLKE